MRSQEGSLPLAGAEPHSSPRPSRLAEGLLGAGLATICVAAIGAVAGPPSWAVPVDVFQQVATTCAALMAMLLMWRAAPAGQRWVPAGLAVAFAVASTGMAAWGIIGSIVAFSSRVGCAVLAVAVETKAEADMLAELGVGLGQGYLFGRPEPLATAVGHRPAA